MMMVLVVVSVFGTELYIRLICVPLLLVLCELNAEGSIDLKYGQGGQAVRDFLEHYIIDNI